jgi:hypothetical protein
LGWRVCGLTYPQTPLNTSKLVDYSRNVWKEIMVELKISINDYIYKKA